MRKNVFILYTACVFILLLQDSCRERFVPEMSDFESTIVIEGLLTNESGPYTVNVSLTTDIRNKEYQPMSNCRVVLMDNAGNEELLSEISPGKYQSNSQGIQGEIGRFYKLVLETPKGKKYMSPYQKLRKPVEIDTVYASVDYKPTEDEFIHELPGYQFYIDTKEVSSHNSYFMWRMNETYEYHSDFYIDGVLKEDGIVDFWPDDSLYYCYKTEKVGDIFISKTDHLTEPRITGHPPHFIGTDTKKIQVLYSLLVKQYCINKETYLYWKDLEGIISGQNFFNMKQPYHLAGNIFNIEDSSDIALGYFTVASVNKERYFFKRPDVKFYFEKCYYRNSLPPYTGHDFFVFKDHEGKWSYAGQKCMDCRMHGGEIEKPEFWINHLNIKTKI